MMKKKKMMMGGGKTKKMMMGGGKAKKMMKGGGKTKKYMAKGGAAGGMKKPTMMSKGGKAGGKMTLSKIRSAANAMGYKLVKKKKAMAKKRGSMKGYTIKSGDKRPTKKGAGRTAKGVAKYRRENPGSKLKTAVTGKVKPGSKDAKRRKSFCARSAGQMKKFPKAAKNPNSRLRQARRRWKC